MKANQGKGERGLTLVEALLLLSVLALLIALLLPARARPRRHSSRLGCVNNLKQIGLSYRQWALDNSDRYPMRISIKRGGAMEWVEQGIAWPVYQVMSNELNTPKILVCPDDETRTNALSFGQNLDRTNLSYFVGVDADEAEPHKMLVGDSNLEADSAPIPAGVLTFLTNRTVGWSGKRHKFQGNVGLADGSAQGFSNKQLRQALPSMGNSTNRMLIP